MTERTTRAGMREEAALRCYVTQRLGAIALALYCVFGFVVREAGAAAPPHLQELIDEGNVSFEYYQRGDGPKDYAARTDYHFEVTPRYTYQYRWPPGTETVLVTVDVRLQKIPCTIKHTILLPWWLDREDKWEHMVVQHEFDHVAITLDPRWQMLLKGSLEQVRRLEHTVPRATTIDDTLVHELINKEYARRREAINAVLQANQQRLDVVSSHGMDPIEDREAYFRSLFGRENLRKLHYPYLTDVEQLLKQKRYREAQLPYSFQALSASR